MNKNSPQFHFLSHAHVECIEFFRIVLMSSGQNHKNTHFKYEIWATSIGAKFPSKYYFVLLSSWNTIQNHSNRLIGVEEKASDFFHSFQTPSSIYLTKLNLTKEWLRASLLHSWYRILSKINLSIFTCNRFKITNISY